MFCFHDIFRRYMYRVKVALPSYCDEVLGMKHKANLLIFID
jgi:hypothetical protein